MLGRSAAVVANHRSAHSPNRSRPAAGSTHAPRSLAASFSVSHRSASTLRANTLNPDAIPERTLTEIDLSEFGPVSWPAYAGATAGVA